MKKFLDHDRWHRACSGFEIVAGEFVVVTPDDSDLPWHQPLSSLLRRVRRAFGFEVAFIADSAEGATVIRCSSSGTDNQPSASGELHALYGRRLLESEVGLASTGAPAEFDAVPVVTAEGLEYGTLCCRRSVAPNAEFETRHANALHSVAQLIAEWFEDADLSLSGLMPLSGDSVMGGLSLGAY